MESHRGEAHCRKSSGDHGDSARVQRSVGRCARRADQLATAMRYVLLLILCAAPLAYANDFPTRARVEFVLACMRDSKGSPQESMYKCSCAIDAIAEKINYNDWVDLSTIANGITIAGERGCVVRDMKDARKLIAAYRELQDNAKKQCFIRTD